jgi:hypothetical protein
MTGSRGERDPERDDVERVAYLVETSPDGRLTARELSRQYKMVFGTKFRSEVFKLYLFIYIYIYYR